MKDFTRRTLLQGGTALAAAGALTGPALLEFAKAWAQSAPWKPEPGANPNGDQPPNPDGGGDASIPGAKNSGN